MSRINLGRIDLNLLVTFEALMDLGSVTLAAERLGRTPSAVSHALQRLREQVNDPLMVKVGGRMQPSPFALTLIEDIRPLLRGIERVITPPDAFDPLTGTRSFRVVMQVPAVMSAVMDRVRKEAPGVDIEWLNLGPLTTREVIEERVDLAFVPAGTPLSDGLDSWTAPEMARLTFARADHPAISEWSMEAWLAYPHVVVDAGGAARRTVQEAVERDGLERRIGMRVSEFAAVAPLLARSDNLGTFPALLLAEDAMAFGLAFLAPPIKMPSIATQIIWNTRLANDPASRWLRETVIAAYEDAERRIGAILSEVEIVQPRA
jgi:DNA-binding transcriptional LysR family regulator